MYTVLKYSLLWLFFTLPISSSFLFWDKFSYFSWNYSPWTSFVINISDIFLILSLFLYFLIIFKQKKISWEFSIFKIFNPEFYFDKKWLSINIVFILLSIALFIPIFFAKDFILHFLIYIKFISYLFLFIYLPKEVISKNEIANILLISFALQIIIAVFQFYLQSPIWLHILWEPNIWKDILWIAKIDLINWEKIVRPYWTMLHANIFWISCAITYFLGSFSYFPIIRYLMIVWVIISFSRTAWLLFWIIFLFEIFFRKKESIKNVFIVSIIPILLLINIIIQRLNIFDSSFYDRIKLFTISLKMFLKYPFWVWFWNFTILMQEFSKKLLNPWEMQPVHNFFALFINEAWLAWLSLFLILLCILFIKSKENLFTKIIIIFIIFVVWSFDHLFLTSTIWMVLLFGLIRFI